MSQSRDMSASATKKTQAQEKGSDTGAAPDIQSILFSTIMKKVSNPALKKSNVSQETVNVFKSLVQSSAINSRANEQQVKSLTQEAGLQREKFLLEGEDLNKPIPFQKKGKSMGSVITRDVHLQEGTFSFLQGSGVKPSKTAKQYPLPKDFVAQTKSEFDATSKKGLPWLVSSKNNVNYTCRILFRRRPKPIDESATLRNEEGDSAFYFETQDELLKVRNYFKLLRILDLDDRNQAYNQRIPSILYGLCESFKLQLIGRARRSIRRHAEQSQNIIKGRKKEEITKSVLLCNFDNYLRKDFIERLLNKAEGSFNAQKQDEERVKTNASKAQLLDNILFIKNYDANCVGKLLTTWSKLAEMRSLPDRETMDIIFSGIEIPTTVIKPIFKVLIMVERKNPERSYPGAISINGNPTLSETIEIPLNAVIKRKATNNTLLWKLSPLSIGSDASKSSEANDRFVLHLDAISREYLDCIQLKFTLHDENYNLKALYFAPLNNFYLPSKRGKDISFAIGEDNHSQYILHLQVFSHPPENTLDYHDKSKHLEEDFIDDTFFNYSFPFPNINPRNHKFLCLLPESWRILDENMRNTHRSGNLGKWVQKVKYRIARNYHKSCARHIAKIERSNGLWAELQTDLATYSSTQDVGAEQIFLDDYHLEKLTNIDLIVKDPYGHSLAGPNQDNTTVVSYLFKRDRWETSNKWRPFYNKLYQICYSGIPSQLRKIIWPELGRVCYFVELTENVMRSTSQNRVSSPTYPQPSSDKTMRNLRIYEQIKQQSTSKYYYLYQELEEDINVLREEQGKVRLDYEVNLRNVCKAFIHWSNIFADFHVQAIRYYVSYSKAILTICQSLVIALGCNYLQDSSNVDEDVVFWLLIAVSTYILASYYETNEESLSVELLTADPSNRKGRKINKITSSALRCYELRGIKGDLLLLKLLLREQLPEIAQKFEELGLPVEYYFAEHMLTLFSTLFSPALTFRIWDLIFLEGSASNQVRSHRTIVLTVFTLLQNCKRMLLRAKNSNEIKFVIELYGKICIDSIFSNSQWKTARSEVDFDDFINEVHSNVSKLMDQTLPDTETIAQKISYIRFVFSKDFNKFDKKILEIEDQIREYHRAILEQNLTVFALVNSSKVSSDSKIENLDYTTLSDILDKFIRVYAYPDVKKPAENYSLTTKDEPETKTQQQNSQKIKLFTDSDSDPQKFLKDRFSHVQIIVHRMNIYWPDLEHLTLRISYDKEHRDKTDLTTLDVGFLVEFPIQSWNNIARYVHIELIDTKDKQAQKKVKSVDLDLRSIVVDALTKMVLKLDEETSKLANDNFTTSEIEISVLLIGLPRANDMSEIVNQPRNFVIPELQCHDPHQFDYMKLDSIFQRFSGEQEEILSLDSMHYTLFNKSKTAWKNNFRMTFQEFIDVMKKIAPFWTGKVDFMRIYTSIQNAAPNQAFYFNDFITLLILFGKFPFRQKMSLLFQLYSAFNDCFKAKNDLEVSTAILKGVTSFLYDVFMFYIPQSNIDNMVDNILKGSSTVVIRAVINPDVAENKVNLPASTFNNLANHMHTHFFSKDIYLGDAEMLKYLKDIYLSEQQNSSNPSNYTLNQRNKFEILYFSNGMRHKYKVEFDDNWKIVSDNSSLINTNLKLNMRLLCHNRNVVPLNHSNVLLKEHEFIRALERMPMLEYLFGFENILNKQDQINTKTKISFDIKLSGHTAYKINCVHGKKPEPVEGKEMKNSPKKHIRINTNDNSMISQAKSAKKAFKQILKEWQVLVRSMAESKAQRSQFNQKMMRFRHEEDEDQEDHLTFNFEKEQDKLSIYYPLKKLVGQVKKYIIKDLYNKTTSKGAKAEMPKNLLFREDLYNLDYLVSITVNEEQTKKVLNFGDSIYESLHAFDRAFSGQIDDIGITIDMQLKAMDEPVEESFNQIALYRYADSSTEWLPCRIIFKYLTKAALEYGKKKFRDHIEYEDIEGFGIYFKILPTEIVVKKRSEVALIHGVELSEVETRQIEDMQKEKDAFIRVLTVTTKPVDTSFAVDSGTKISNVNGGSARTKSAVNTRVQGANSSKMDIGEQESIIYKSQSALNRKGLY